MDNETLIKVVPAYAYFVTHRGQIKKNQELFSLCVQACRLRFPSLTDDQCIDAMSKMAKMVIEDRGIRTDGNKLAEFRKEIEEAFGTEPLVYEAYRDEDWTSIEGTEHEALLEERHNFSDWKRIFLRISPWQAAELGSFAIDDEDCAAYGSTHFWLAVIDDLVKSAILTPHLDLGLRAKHLEMADKYKGIVRAYFDDDPESLAKCEKAWAVSRAKAEDMVGDRNYLFETGHIDRWGRDTR